MSKPKSRLTVVETVYHQAPQEEPQSNEVRFCRELESDEQPYGPRRLTATEDWRLLDCGWLSDEVSMLTIRNEEGRNLQVIPTEAEQAEIDARVLEVGYYGGTPDSLATGASWLIPPGESMRGCPKSIEKLSIRCRSGEARYTLTAYPL